MDRDVRILFNGKQNKIKVDTGMPLKANGSNGDIQIRANNLGVVLYIKYNNSWYYSTMTKQLGG